MKHWELLRMLPKVCDCSKFAVEASTLFLNHPQKYEKLDSYLSDTAENNEKFVVSSGI